LEELPPTRRKRKKECENRRERNSECILYFYGIGKVGERDG
jgi:hypothetical protein